MKELIPQELHDRGYIKPWLDKPFSKELSAEIFKKLDGAETLVGRKVGIPDWAKDEEVEGFFAKMRPEKETDYEIPVKGPMDEELSAAFRKAMHKGGLSTTQAKKMNAELFAALAAREQKQAAEQKKMDDNFLEITKGIWGSDQAKVTEEINGHLKEYVPDQLKPFIGRLDNNALAILAATVKNMHAKFGVEDGGKRTGGNGSGGAKSVQELRAEARDLMGKPEYKDFMHKEHASVNKRIEEIYAEINRLGNK